MLGCLRAKVNHYAKNETIIAEGEPAKYVGIVLSGTMQIEQTDYYGNRSIVAGIEPSEWFGESFACAGVEMIPVNVVANEESKTMFVDCLRITQSCSIACSFHQQIIYNLMKGVATKNLMFHQKIEITSKRSIRKKLLTYLLLLAKKNNSNRYEIPYDRQGLADYQEVERSGLSAEIRKLRKEGVIECRKNWFEVL